MKGSRVQDARVEDYMTRDPVTATPDETLGDVLSRMRSHDIHELPVLENRRLVGLVTMWSLMRRKDAPPGTKVRTVMSTSPAVAPEEDIPTVAAKLISTGYRAVPVLRDHRLQGILSRTDITRAIAESEEFDRVRVGEVMTPNPITVGESDTAAQATKVIQSLGERSVPVVDAKGRLVGVIGLKDLAELFGRSKRRPGSGERASEKGKLSVPVKSLMNEAPVTAPAEATVRAAAELMLRSNVSSVVVPDQGKPVGVLTKLDLLESVAAVREREEVLVQISGLEEQPEVYDSLYDVIQKGMRKIGAIVTPRTLTIHVQTYKAEGDRSKFSLRCRLATTHKMYYVNHHDWDLAVAAVGLMDQIEKLVIREKERRITQKKRHHLP